MNAYITRTLGKVHGGFFFNIALLTDALEFGFEPDNFTLQ